MYNWLKDHKIYIIYIPLVLYWILIFVLTTIPASSIPEIFGLTDKLKHISAYFGLAVLLGLTLHYQNKFLYMKKFFLLFTIIIIAVYGALDEIHQMLVPNRTCDIFDWIADLGGGLIGIILIYLFIKFRRKLLPGEI